jgi:ABC-type transport system substrate-binding protein
MCSRAQEGGHADTNRTRSRECILSPTFITPSLGVPIPRRTEIDQISGENTAFFSKYLPQATKTVDLEIEISLWIKIQKVLLRNAVNLVL